MPALKDVSDFKFRYCRDGRPANVFAVKGGVTQDGLVLGKGRVAWDQITDTTTRDDRIVVMLRDHTGLDPEAQKNLVDGSALVLAVAKPTALELERAIDRRSSDAEIARTRQHLQAQGRIAELRTEQCPACDSAINLTGLQKTPYVACRFCDTVFDGQTRAIVTDSEHRPCSECNFFDRTRGYTEFYFYFLLVVYGFSYKRRHLCDGCAGRLFWKVFLINFIFVLGIFPAIWLKVKSITGRNPKLRQLADANSYARNGNIAKADPLYEQVLRELPNHPGVLFNQAMAHFNATDAQGGALSLQQSLQACANYPASVRLAQTLTEHSAQMKAEAGATKAA